MARTGERHAESGAQPAPGGDNLTTWCDGQPDVVRLAQPGRGALRGVRYRGLPGVSPRPHVAFEHLVDARLVTGTRQGRIVLARLLNALDPDTGQRFTVKRYRSEKTANDDGWRHLSIVLEPLNPDFEPMELTGEDESPVAVIAELIDVIGQGDPVSSEA